MLGCTPGLLPGANQGLQQGIEQGQVQGQLAERQRLLGHLLEKRFGPLPAADQRRIAAADYATLAVWVDRIFQAQSLAEVFAPG